MFCAPYDIPFFIKFVFYGICEIYVYLVKFMGYML